MAKHILVVDDEQRIREVVEYALRKEGFAVTSAADGRTAVTIATERDIDLVVLDVMLPDIDGLEVCRRIRAKKGTPILFLSARGEEIDRVVGLELGGDDYLTKPFSPRELTARVRAVFRRTAVADAASDPSPKAPSSTRKHGQIELDSERHEVRFAGSEVSLTPTEFGLLAALLERPGVVLSRAQLVQRAYAFDNHVTERTIDTHVRRIRAKFRALGGDPIATVHGIGYKTADLER